MYNSGKLRKLKTFLTSLVAYKGLKIYHTTLKEELEALEVAINQRLDMDDAIQYSSALELKAEAIISFDKHLDNLKIPRKEPKKVE